MSDINPGNVYLQTRYNLNTVCSISDGSSIAPSCHPYCQCNYHLITTLTLQHHPISIARVRHLDRTALHLPRAFQHPIPTSFHIHTSIERHLPHNSPSGTFQLWITWRVSINLCTWPWKPFQVESWTLEATLARRLDVARRWVVHTCVTSPPQSANASDLEAVQTDLSVSTTPHLRPTVTFTNLKSPSL